jgi:hypothetical protein
MRSSRFASTKHFAQNDPGEIFFIIGCAILPSCTWPFFQVAHGRSLRVPLGSTERAKTLTLARRELNKSI